MESQNRCECGCPNPADVREAEARSQGHLICGACGYHDSDPNFFRKFENEGVVRYTCLMCTGEAGY